MFELQRFLDGHAQLTGNILAGIMAIDIVLAHQPATQHLSLGRAYYFGDSKSSEMRELPGGLLARAGLFQSARPSIGYMLVSADLAATTFYPSGPLMPIIAELLEVRPATALTHITLNALQLVRLRNFLIGRRFQVTHRGKPSPNYRVSQITTDDAKGSFFNIRDSERRISVADYFRETYNYRLVYPQLPCIVTGRNAIFPLEVCDLLPNQPNRRRLTPRQVDGMLRFTKRNPPERLQAICNGMEQLDHDRNPYMASFGVAVDTARPVAANARVLPAPDINFHPNPREVSVRPQNGAWNLINKRFTLGVTLASWAIVNFDIKADHQKVVAFARELGKMAHQSGMNVIADKPPIFKANRQSDVAMHLRVAWFAAEKQYRCPPQVIVCIKPDDTVPLYAEIKRVSDTQLGVVTQCIVAKHLKRCNPQYLANVCMKLNAKLGGINSTIPRSQLSFVRDKPTIVLGADVWHPTPGDQARPSIAALVGSVNPTLTRYISVTRQQPARTEVIGAMQEMVESLLKTFYRITKRKPARILLYRDGVSEGERAKIRDQEVSAIKNACQSLESTYNPKLTYVTVQKRHHIRLFPQQRTDADLSGSCQPGTVIDTDITSPCEFDFYLQSHASIQGTSRPVHYQVLHDENCFAADDLQPLTYNMCHLCARCTRSVSIVPAVYYANILAARTRFCESAATFDKQGDALSGSGEVVLHPLHSNLKDAMPYL